MKRSIFFLLFFIPLAFQMTLRAVYSDGQVTDKFRYRVANLY